MAALDALKQQWQPCLRWIGKVQTAQAQVMAETGIAVPIDRAMAHMYVETGGTGDPTIRSQGVNQSCAVYGKTPGVDCAADLHAHGLFQIYWPPFSGVNWNKINDPDYNSYLGLKTLAIRKQQCGGWDAASRAFFAGHCTDMGTVDTSTNTSENQYVAAINQHMAELNQLGIGSGGGGTSTNPKSTPTPTPTNPPPSGATNTTIAPPANCVSILGQQVCAPDVGSLISTYITDNFPRAILVTVGALILFIALRRIVNA